MDAPSGEDTDLSTDELLALYRKKRAERAEASAGTAADGAEDGPGGADEGPRPAAAADGAAGAGAADQRPADAGTADAGPAHEEPPHRETHDGGDDAAGPGGPPPAPDGEAAAGTADAAHAPGAADGDAEPLLPFPKETQEEDEDDEDAAHASITYQGPLTLRRMHLLEKTREDRLLASRGTAWLRVPGTGLLLLGAVLLLLDRRLVQVGRANWIGTSDILLLHFAAAVMGTGLVLLLLGLFLPARRRLRIPLPPSQGDLWPAVRSRLGRVRVAVVVGWSLVGLCGLLALYGVVGVPAEAALLYVAAGALVGLAGIVVVSLAVGRRDALREVLAQTLILAALEKSGLGPPPEEKPSGPDPRVFPVLRRLDRMLGALPDDVVQEFLQSPEAKMYLRLMEEAEGEGGG